MTHKIALLAKTNSIVGEGPLWNHLEKKLYFVDIRGKCFWRMDWNDQTLQRVDLPQQLGCLAFAENGDLLLAMEDGVYRRNEAGELRLAHAPAKIKGRRFNDGKVGPDGRFYLGTTDDAGQGAFYCLHDGQLVELFGGAYCANGLDWTADAGTMYYVDSPVRAIEMFDFCPGAPQPLTNRRRCWDAKHLGPQNVQPDGMCIDAEGMLWTAFWGGWMALRINPKTGEVLDKLELPVERVSSCAFAGENMDQLIVSTAAYQADMHEQPLAGCIFRVQVDVPGVLPNLYKG